MLLEYDGGERLGEEVSNVVSGGHSVEGQTGAASADVRVRACAQSRKVDRVHLSNECAV